MKKPLLLLVVDDTAVLESLEAALRPRFESICRIEGYGSAEEALAAVPRWAEEKRPIAVAIVDQKMPGMSGLEFLTRLRADAAEEPGHPATHLRAILLTGYAGLDSAIAAKNEAGVDRYLEKPWNIPTLARDVWGCFSAALEAEERAEWYEFREVRDDGELRAHLELRARVYRTSVIAHLLPEGDLPLDVDEYDAASRHFGLFREGFSGSEMVGTLRVTGTADTESAPRLERVVGRVPSLRSRLGAPRRYPLPMMKYLVDRAAVEILVDEAQRKGERIVEPGRLTIVSEFRSWGISGRHLASRVTESAVALFFLLDVQHAVLTCVPPHDRFYRRLGFVDTPGTRTRLHESLGHEVCCLHGRPTWVPDGARATIASLIARVRSRDATCFCPTFPDCLPTAYETGDFVPVDAFCPVAAAEIGIAVRKTQDPRPKTQD